MDDDMRTNDFYAVTEVGKIMRGLDLTVRPEFLSPLTSLIEHLGSFLVIILLSRNESLHPEIISLDSLQVL
jgi:hypothetical protein